MLSDNLLSPKEIKETAKRELIIQLAYYEGKNQIDLFLGWLDNEDAKLINLELKHRGYWQRYKELKK